jgi:ureidoacrylate peracid hydrolase
MDMKARLATIAAKPDALTIDVSKTAVIVVDMQNDFGAKGGMFDRAGLDLSVIQAAVGPTSEVIAQARECGIPIIYIKEVLSPDLSDVGGVHSPHGRMAQRLGIGESAPAPDGQPSRIHIDNTWHTEILSELAPQAGDTIIKKRRWSAFYETELDAKLRALGVQYLIVTGCTTSVCIESTIRDAAFRDYACLLPADCTGQPPVRSPHSTHEASLLVIARHFGWVTTSHDLLRALGE